MYKLLSFDDTVIDQNTAILFFGIFFVISIILIFLLIRGIRKERKKYAEIKAGHETMSTEVLEKMMEQKFKLNPKRGKFVFYYLQLLDTDNIVSAFGKDVYEDALYKLIARLENAFSWGIRICRYATDVIALYEDDVLSARDIKDHAELIVFEAKKQHIMAANLKFNMAFNMAVNERNEFNKTKEEFWQNTRTALDSARKAGANQYAIFSVELTNANSEEYKFYQEIKQAIEDKEFELYYQPIFDFNRNETMGYESLIRWNHKSLGVLSPDRFLKIMEQSGDINWVGIWAFEEIVKQSIEWKHKTGKRFIMAMNLSPKQLMSDRLVDELRRIAKKYHVNNADFSFEINEFLVFDQMDVIKNNITKLRQAGFLVAIDEYGLEANSVSLLEKIDIDVIKLDRDFLSRAQENFLTGSLMAMLNNYATKKNAIIIAEGIEEEGQIELARKFGIEYGQGYYFGKPQSAKFYNQ